MLPLLHQSATVIAMTTIYICQSADVNESSRLIDALFLRNEHCGRRRRGRKMEIETRRAVWYKPPPLHRTSRDNSVVDKRASAWETREHVRVDAAACGWCCCCADGCSDDSCRGRGARRWLVPEVCLSTFRGTTVPGHLPRQRTLRSGKTSEGIKNGLTGCVCVYDLISQQYYHYYYLKYRSE